MKILSSVSSNDVRLIEKKFSGSEQLLRELITDTTKPSNKQFAIKMIAAIALTLASLSSDPSIKQNSVEVAKDFARYVTVLLKKPTPEIPKYFSATLGIRGTDDDKVDPSAVFKDLAILFDRFCKSYQE